MGAQAYKETGQARKVHHSLFATFFTLRILFFDLLISVGDVATDFYQAWNLYTTSDLQTYGIITFAINWLPGLVAAIHCISVKRDIYGAKKTIMWAGILLLFYPIIPSLSFIVLLWVSPSGTNSESTKAKLHKLSRLSSIKERPASVPAKELRVQFKEIQQEDFQEVNFQEVSHLATLAHAIAGGIESPMQFTLQMWLIFVGKIPNPLYQSQVQVSFVDSAGNSLTLPHSSLMSIGFSLISMLKSLVEFNIIGTHIEEVSNFAQFARFCRHCIDHLPFFATSLIFRLTSMALCLTYFNELGLVPVAIFWLVNVVMGYNASHLESNPLWLMSFVSLFFPVSSTTEFVQGSATKANAQKQYKMLRNQSWACAAIYGITCGVMFYIVGWNKDWKYNPGTIFHHDDFMLLTLTNVGFGIISAILGLCPNIFQMMEKLVHYLKPPPEEELPDCARGQEPQVVLRHQHKNFCKEGQEEGHQQHQNLKLILRILVGLILTIVVILPLIIAMIQIHASTMPNPILASIVEPTFKNHTIAIKSWLVKGRLKANMTGCLHPVDIEDNPIARKVTKCFSDQAAKFYYLKREKLYGKKLPEEAKAVIIIDNDFQPSYPLSDIRSSIDTEDESTPVILVQKDDFYKLLNAMTMYPISIMQDTSQLEDMTKFVCDSNQCLAPAASEWKSQGFVAGQQARQIECYWGSSACLGFENKAETEPFCNGADTHINFCDTFVGQIIQLEGQNREIQLPKSRMRDEDTDFEACVNNCDSTGAWTNYTLENQLHSKFKTRYCQVGTNCHTNPDCYIIAERIYH